MTKSKLIERIKTELAYAEKDAKRNTQFWDIKTHYEGKVAAFKVVLAIIGEGK